MPHNFFFFNDTATTEIYTLSLHDALPILPRQQIRERVRLGRVGLPGQLRGEPVRPVPDHPLIPGEVPQRLREDRKSTRLNSSHSQISYAVFCLKKKKTIVYQTPCSPDTLI